MSFKLEKQENSMAEITVEVSAEELEKAMQNVYARNKKTFSVPGFRKGKVPRQMIERMYGKDVFCQDAAYDIMDQEYAKVLEECEETIVSDPEIDVTQLEAGKPFIFKAVVALKPELRLGKYKGVKIPRQDLNVTEEEIDEAVDRERESNSRTITVEDRPVQDKDIVTIDFEGFVDGVAFEGGKGDNYPLTIGSGAFIPGFEEQLIGASLGDAKDVNVTFPEDYHAEDLAGKAAVFHVSIKEIKEKQIPEADDDFASEVSEFDTLAEYRDSLRDQIKERKELQARAAKEDAALEEVIKDSDVEIPPAMLTTQARQMLREFDQRLRMQGMDLENYYKFTGTDEEKMLEEFQPQAERRIKSRLALEAVVAAENIVPTEDDLNKEIENAAKEFNMEVDKYKEIMMPNEKAVKQMKDNLACTMAVDFLVNNAVETEPEEKKENE